MDWDEYHGKKNHDSALLARGKRKRCPSCGLYGCICQTTIEEFRGDSNANTRKMGINVRQTENKLDRGKSNLR